MAIESAPIEIIRIGSSYTRAKRLVDILFTLLIAPFVIFVGLIIALLIRLDSPGPIFYRQRRVGQNGEEFDMIKFRSMYVHCDDTTHRTAIEHYMNGEKLSNDFANPYKLTDDERITQLGKFIRKTSLDELPQFWNVLRGQMSIVGPRPPLPYETERYSEHDWLRLFGKPGVTGHWQIYGRGRVPFQEMVEMDITYLRNQSLWRDCKYIILTIPVMLFARGGR